jgi:hypothetical protein
LALKFDGVVIFAAIESEALWIEHGHRTLTDATTPAEFAAHAGASTCPENENKPYTASCIAFLEGSGTSALHWRPAAAKQVATSKHVEITAIASRPACADSDTMPYSANCIAFMTGWFWRPNTP